MSYQTFTNSALDSSLCLDSNGNVAQNGSKINMVSCNGQANQNWFINQSNNTLQSNLGNRSFCVDLPAGNTTNGTQLELWDCSINNPNQNWKLSGNTFVHQSSGKCMDVNTNNKIVEIWDCNNKNTNQSFIGHESNPIVDCTQGDNIVSNSFCSNDLKQKNVLLYNSILSTYCYNNGKFDNMNHGECIALFGELKDPTVVLSPISSVCSDTSGNVQLGNACACQKASNDLQTATSNYYLELEKYNISVAVYNNQNAAFQDWDRKKTAFLTKVRTQTQRGTCALAGNCGASTCPAGWISDGSITGYLFPGNCDVLGVATGCAVNCIQNEATVQSALKPWLVLNPPPPTNIQTLQTPNAPAINIQCCSQLLSGITANTINSELQQNCNQQITNQIISASNPTTPSPTSNNPTTTIPSTTSNPDPTTTIPSADPTTTVSNSESNNNLIIAGIIVVAVIIFFFFIGIICLLII